MDNPNIPADDQERIDLLVSEFRHRMENLYRMGYLQGAIDEATETRNKMRKDHPLISGDLATQRAIHDKVTA